MGGGGIGRSCSRSRGGRDKDGFHSHRNAVVHLTGIGSLMAHASEPGIPSDSLFGGDRLCTSKRAGRAPMKMVIDDEVSRDVIARHTSPSPGVVGRLMGLDTMPSFGVHSQSTCSGSHSQNKSPGSCSDKYGFYGDVPRRRSTDEIPEFKDVFEVMEATRMKNGSPKSRNMCSRPDKVNTADMNFVRQKLMDAKRLSTDESFQISKEFSDALEALVSKKDLLLEFLQESNPVPMNVLPDLSCPPSSSVNRITILKPSRRNKFIDADVIYPPEEDTERSFHAPREVKNPSRKPYINFSSPTPKEDAGSVRQKLSRSCYQESIDKHISSTRIVVLKPCPEKTQNMEGAFSLTHEMFHSSYRRPKAVPDDGIRSPYTEQSMHQMSTGDSDVLGHRGKGSGEIAREVTKQMREAARGGVSGKQLLNPDIGTFSWDDQVSLSSSMAKLKSSEASQSSFALRDAWGATSFGSSPTYLTKTSIRKEARRRLSDRWKVTHQYQHPSQDTSTFGTLGDMLALSDREASKVTSGSEACRKCPKGELHRDGMPGSCGYPLGISSNDGWKDENVCNLTRLKSLSSSSINQGSPKLNSRKGSCRRSEFSVLKDIVSIGPYNSEDVRHSRQRRSLIRSSTYHCDGSDVPSLDEEQSMVTEREIHVNFEERTNSAAVPGSCEEILVHPANSYNKLGVGWYLDACSAVPEWHDDSQASASQDQLMHQEPTSTLDDHLLVPSFRDSAAQAEGNGQDRCEGNPALSNPLTELVFPVSSNEDDQPSLVSVLESSLDAEDGYSGGFEKISADLQELRMQLRLLKMEATNNADETELLLLSDDEIPASSEPLNEMGETSYAFRDEDERDFSYVLDVLTCLGIHSADQDFILDACYLSECPVGIDVYVSLEKKYNKLILWPQSDRRLLFDLTNAVLVDIIASLTQCGSTQGMLRNCRSKWYEGLVEEVWQRVVRQRLETECFLEGRLMDVGWSDSDDGTAQIAGEIESMLDKDLLEEIIADLLL